MKSRDRLAREAASRILVFGGEIGAAIRALRLSEADHADGLGLPCAQKGNIDILALSRPEVVCKISDSYFAAGADIVCTNSFNANRIGQAAYGAGHLVREINVAAASIARGLADGWRQRDGRQRFVAGAIGNHGDNGLDFDELRHIHREQCDALIEGGVHFLHIDAAFGTPNARAAVAAAHAASEAAGKDVPVMLSLTIGNVPEDGWGAFVQAVHDANPVVIGVHHGALGCERIRTYLQAAGDGSALVMIRPGADFGVGQGAEDASRAGSEALVARWAKDGLADVVGGPCWSTAAQVRALAGAVRGLPPRSCAAASPAIGISGLPIPA